jgi:hypothetical protein
MATKRPRPSVSVAVFFTVSPDGVGLITLSFIKQADSPVVHAVETTYVLVTLLPLPHFIVISDLPKASWVVVVIPLEQPLPCEVLQGIVEYLSMPEESYMYPD